MFDLNDMYLYTKVVEHGGFASAGRVFGLPKSRLSRRISMLEERLGVRLIQRSTRQFSVTEVGLEYYHLCQDMVAQACAAEDAVERSRSEPRGIVRVACASPLLDTRIAPMLAHYMTQYPAVELLVKSFNRRVDVISEGFDLVIGVHHQPLENRDLVMRSLAQSHYNLVAAPSVLAPRRSPLKPADLVDLPSLSWGLGLQDYTWELEGPGGAVASIHYHPRMVSDDVAVLRAAAVAGAGIVLLPEEVIIDDLKTGNLQIVLEDWTPRTGEIVALFPSRRGLMPAVRVLIDCLALAFERDAPLERGLAHPSDPVHHLYRD
ncbi:LysR family transcriptional regulator [Pseudomonas sp. JQ170]|uniref:LysR substrate-binding domain-containing protein n=1 Tax=unclassified Pseudomonas TaxID=196821 RepID=UPI00264C911E|nr:MULTISPECIES: LysR substrate-binding domain-containing protein [unclassified Pseudomonas]MDN7144274.1 LysR family transcriptional regulator [Pseudomonas sp. JQ170]WRO74171.1 LysR substrate-binding domain-containing protein [Pseudomonas sp. 170C]